MTEQERVAFLAAGTRTAKLATVGGDGRPHVVPIWFALDDDGSVMFMTSAKSLKGKALQRDPRLALCVDDEAPPFSFVTVEGTAKISEDPEDLLRWSVRIAHRYMGADLAERYGRRNAVPGELLVRVVPSKVLAQSGIAD